MPKGWPQFVTDLRPTLFLDLYPLRGCFLSAAFRAAAGDFLLLRQKKVTKEKAAVATACANGMGRAGLRWAATRVGHW
ncbi:hypothetical protein [Vogesella oryzae]|uniref:hypothetical protein n=1 Tax=Vogesella oryzae TaxID=1735285 RepID=UPI0015836D76|nr:hypothetical protein [Vogesella oryzae]